MKTKSSIRISNNGNTIRATGDAANALFNAMTMHYHVNNGIDDKCQQCERDLRSEIHFRICKACECKIDKNGCGCNPHDA